MTFVKQLSIGIKSYSKASQLVFNNGLWVYFFAPLIIYILLLIGGFAVIHSISDALENFVVGYINPDNNYSWLSFLKGFLHFFLSIGLKIIFFFIYSMFSKYIVLILMSPVMSLLSQKTETIMTGKQFPFSANQFIKDITRGILITLRNMFLQLCLLLVSFVVIWIPVIGWFAPMLLCLVSWYFYGFSMMDYMSERRKYNVSQSVSYMRHHKGVAIGNGFIFALIFAIPFVGIIISSVLSPVAASIAVIESEKTSPVL